MTEGEEGHRRGKTRQPSTEAVSAPRDPSYLEGDEGLLVIDVDQHIFPRTE